MKLLKALKLQKTDPYNNLFCVRYFSKQKIPYRYKMKQYYAQNDLECFSETRFLLFFVNTNAKEGSETVRTMIVL